MPDFSIDNAAGSGDLTLVAAIPGQRIVVTSYVLIAGGTVNVFFRDGASGTALTGPFPLAAQAGVMAPVAPLDMKRHRGYFRTSANKALVLNSSQAIQVSGHGTYEVEGVGSAT